MTAPPTPAPTKRVLAIVLAGGKGERLYPLTRDRSKPAVPFGGKYRIIDFALSNFINSGVHSIYVLVQYMSQSLIDHLRSSWRTAGLTREHFIAVVPPQMRAGPVWYQGTADAVRQNLNLIKDFDPDIVAVFGADHIYRMDIGQMIQYHAAKGAEVTVATIPVPLEESRSFGIVETDKEGRIVSFLEKPENPKPMPQDPKRALSSMGNYLFNAETLFQLLSSPDFSAPELDFGKSILPQLPRKTKIYAYDFSTNALPGLKPYEEKSYWRDVGTLSSYYQANMDILGEKPKFDLNNHRWFIHSMRFDGPPAKVLEGKLSDCIIGEGCLIKNSAVRNSILGRGVHVDDGAVIEDSIVMDFCTVGRGAKVKRAIIDRFNQISAKEIIGGPAAAGEAPARCHVDAASGIAVLPRAQDIRRLW